MVQTYNENARRRIREAVLQSERNRSKVPRQRPSRPVYGNQLAVAIAGEDIEHKDFGLANIASGSSFDSDYSPERQITVFNPGEKIWNGAEIHIVPTTLGGAGGEGVKQVIAEAWSATRIRGIAKANISPGSTGTIQNVTPMNGVYSPTGGEASAVLPSGATQVDQGAAVEASLEYRVTGSVWVIRPQSSSEGGGSTGTTIAGWSAQMEEATGNLTLLPMDGFQLIDWDHSSINKYGGFSQLTYNNTAKSVTIAEGEYFVSFFGDGRRDVSPGADVSLFTDTAGVTVRMEEEGAIGSWSISRLAPFCRPNIEESFLVTFGERMWFSVAAGASRTFRVRAANQGTSSSDESCSLVNYRWVFERISGPS